MLLWVQQMTEKSDTLKSKERSRKPAIIHTEDARMREFLAFNLTFSQVKHAVHSYYHKSDWGQALR